MAERQLNMREVARLAEVSVATVSRALREPDKVSDDTRARVNGAAAQLGYIYNAVAGDISTGRSTVIGVLVPAASNALFAETLHSIQDVAMAAGHSTIQGATRYDEAIEGKLIDTLLQRRVKGLVLTGLTYGQEARIAQLATASDVRIVITWEKPPVDTGSISYVGFDNRKASELAVRHLIELGHTRIGLIVGPYSRIARTRHRLDGYRDALDAAGIAFDPSLVLERLPEPVEGREAMEALLAQEEPPTGVFAASDMLAFGALRALHAAGLDVPSDVSLVGFDDVDLAAYTHPPLTTVRVDAARIGRLAAQILIDPAEARSRHYCLDCDLVIRGSTGPVRSGPLRGRHTEIKLGGIPS
ncbi:LacI family transcriptional regulator [Palleronia aestuarii]|uniref:LacI family transcriptional regulator n=1 Tax=Palleronia aestuarii TaxID=568105 RepID=A0A2W7MU03_9RHOB|nr:LacI family DNA-binding transcriptional regulator [Palleronia aestuarii]PZX11300.1 LacI family transcriptional regulator [Palleronia aestuarii]